MLEPSAIFKQLAVFKGVLLLVLAFHGSAADAACTLAQPPNMILGPYTGVQTDTGSTNLTVTCAAGSANYTIDLSGGVSGNTAARTMKSGTIVLNYGLFRDSARSQNWGNTAGTDTYAGNGATASVSVPIYPRILVGQLVAPGTYVDTITTASKSFTVTTTISPSCTVSATAMAFGTYSGSVVDTNANITVTCTNTTSYNISLNQGLATGASVTNRHMTGGGVDLIAYSLSSDAARSINWGQTISTDTVAGVGSGSEQALTVYGRIVAGQRLTPGSYADIIIATITY